MSRSARSGLLMFIGGMTLLVIAIMLGLHDRPFVAVLYGAMFCFIAGGFIFVET